MDIMCAGFLKLLKLIIVSEIVRPTEYFCLYIATDYRAVFLDKFVTQFPYKCKVPEHSSSRICEIISLSTL